MHDVAAGVTAVRRRQSHVACRLSVVVVMSPRACGAAGQLNIADLPYDGASRSVPSRKPPGHGSQHCSSHARLGRARHIRRTPVYCVTLFAVLASSNLWW